MESNQGHTLHGSNQVGTGGSLEQALAWALALAHRENEMGQLINETSESESANWI